MPCYAIDGLVPVVDLSAHVHPSAVLIGDVWIEAGANVQDNCTLHGFPGADTLVEIDGHIGHGAVLHGCVVRRDALVGMNAVVMDDAEIGAQAIVAASAFVRAGMQVPPRTLVAGVPGKVLREPTASELQWKREGTRAYQGLTRRCQASLLEVEPLTADNPARPRLSAHDVSPGLVPLAATKMRAR